MNASVTQTHSRFPDGSLNTSFSSKRCHFGNFLVFEGLRLTTLVRSTIVDTCVLGRDTSPVNTSSQSMVAAF